MNHRQLQVIEYLREENRVLREQQGPSSGWYVLNYTAKNQMCELDMSSGGCLTVLGAVGVVQAGG